MKALRPVFSSTLTDEVESRIYEYLKARSSDSNETFPKEIEIAKLLGVSRHIVREALSRLKMLKIIESRKKKGMFLGEPDIFIGLEKIINLDLIGKEKEQELFELRVVLEIGLAEFIYLRKTEEDIQELEEIASRYDESLSASDIMDRTDVEFHSRLLLIARNSTISRLGDILCTFFKILWRRHASDYINSNAPTHMDLCVALKKGTVSEFKNALNNHLNSYIKS